MKKLGKAFIAITALVVLAIVGIIAFGATISDEQAAEEAAIADALLAENPTALTDSECFKLMKTAKGQVRYIEDIGTRLIALDIPIEKCGTVEEFLQANELNGGVVQEIMRLENIEPINVLINRCGPDSPVPVKGPVCEDLKRLQEKQEE